MAKRTKKFILIIQEDMPYDDAGRMFNPPEITRVHLDDQQVIRVLAQTTIELREDRDAR
jgi:hypothetical protein